MNTSSTVAILDEAMSRQEATMENVLIARVPDGVGTYVALAVATSRYRSSGHWRGYLDGHNMAFLLARPFLVFCTKREQWSAATYG